MQPISAGCIPAKIQFMDNTLNGVIIVPRCVKRIPLWPGSHMDTYLFTANLQQHILSPGANHCQISNLFHALLLPYLRSASATNGLRALLLFLMVSGLLTLGMPLQRYTMRKQF